MDEIAHDPVARRPVASVAEGVVGAEAAAVAHGLAAVGAETHGRKTRRPIDPSMGILLTHGKRPLDGIRRIRVAPQRLGAARPLNLCGAEHPTSQSAGPHRLYVASSLGVDHVANDLAP